MRAALSLSILLLGLLVSGCVAEDPVGEPTSQAERAAPARDVNATLEGLPEFCPSEDDCDYWDQEYHEYVVYDLDTTVIDVVIVPPAGPTALDVIAASRQAVQAWEDGVRAMASPWFNESFEVNVYAVGVDVPSLAAVQDPEIVVVSTTAEFLVGIGLEPKQIACQVIGGGDVARDLPGDHVHGASQVMAADCTGTGFTCFALNVGAADARGLYDLVAHEVGHCFGAGHVGDAGDFHSRYAPIEDIMSYQENPDQVHCVSSMNVRVLEGVYAHLVEGSNATALPAGTFYHESPLDYHQVACPNP